jgi:hypothetical protein
MNRGALEEVPEARDPREAGEATREARDDADPGLLPTELLTVRHRKRLSHRYTTSDTGARELSLSYGIHEITFDEDRLFPFGEQLVSQSSFTAGSAASWGPGYDWEEIRPLLETLLELGIVRRGGEVEDTRGTGLVAPLLPPAECKVHRTWSAADSESITRDLAGRAVELGYIEAFVFTFRLAHSALDADGRQVGEANVYPSRLRIDQDTEWRVCQYPGSRYRDDAPMNVTALKAMIKHWKPMMVTLLEVRADVRRRLGYAQEPWTAGDLHTFANVVLTLPAFLLMRRGGASPQPVLDPVLSSLFRITDGIRMTTHEMLFLLDEDGRLPTDRTGAAHLWDFAERRSLLMTDTGVCAGPRAMIDEFLAIVCDGRSVEGADAVVLPPDVQGLLAELPAAVDYGLYALQVWAVVRSVWVAMSQAYASLRDLLDDAGDSEICVQLRERLAAERQLLARAQVAGDREREVQHRVHADSYERAWRALRAPVGPATLDARIAPRPEGAAEVEAARTLRELIGPRLFGAAPGGPANQASTQATIDGIVASLVRYLREEQAILAAATELEDTINHLLERPVPVRPLTVRDCRVAYRLRDDHLSGFPYLFDTLEDLLGIAVECTRDCIAISDRRADQLA